ncbi:MAG TPA: glutaminase A [Verrucomicrobiae bacterium]|nr:glutaminase A [Verrucomicrobiae bacterium]
MKNRDQSKLVSPIQEFLEELHEECAAVKDGEVAAYIPELAKADANWFGLCLVTANGSVYEVGDTRQEFTIQSISKPFVYGIALEDNGREATLKRVGVEPTGDAFNSISLDPGTGRPRNPMINAGAIATAGLIAGKSARTKFKRVLETFSLYAGRGLSLDEKVYRSESETGHRDRAIGHMLRNFDKLTGDPAPTTELYFQQCSISVNCRDLGMMAATLANRGVNPVTGKQAIRGEYVESVLSVMGTCGMYDYAGEWLYNVGIPAKSGVAGGVLAVLPGQLGIGVFSPKLDPHGNSVRGIRVCQELSRRLNLHLFNRAAVGRSTIRLKFSGAEFNSSRVRTPQEDRVLRESANAIQVYQLQGNLNFATTEPVVRDVLECLAGGDFFVFDLRHVLSLDESAGHLMHSLVAKLAATGQTVVFTHHGHLPLLRRMMKSKLGAKFDSQFHSFDDNDLALEWCENDLLEKRADSRIPTGRMSIADHHLLREFSPEELEIFQPLLKNHSFKRGQEIIAAGAEAREMFFLSRGVVSVHLPGEEHHRLASFSPGMCFGEMAFIDEAPRSADIVADTDVECHSLSLEDFSALGRLYPTLKIKLLEQLCLDLTQKLRKANRELAVLE